MLPGTPACCCSALPLLAQPPPQPRHCTAGRFVASAPPAVVFAGAACHRATRARSCPSCSSAGRCCSTPWRCPASDKSPPVAGPHPPLAIVARAGPCCCTALAMLASAAAGALYFCSCVNTHPLLVA
ncbi:hypothetical protein VPH35_013334 [Triticum aestivum]